MLRGGTVVLWMRRLAHHGATFDRFLGGVQVRGGGTDLLLELKRRAIDHALRSVARC